MNYTSKAQCLGEVAKGPQKVTHRECLFDTRFQKPFLI